MSMSIGDLGMSNTGFASYAKEIDLPAFRITRGGQPIYTICPTIEMVLDLLPTPDPQKKFPNNRLLHVPHAVSWGKYWEQNPASWGCPAGLVSTPTSLEPRFHMTAAANGMQVGVLKLPHGFAQRSEILDMQHRIYGWYDKRRDIGERIIAAQKGLEIAKKSGPDALVIQYESKIANLEVTRTRFSQECITVEICELSQEQHRDLFANIASKALSINAAQIADFDESQAINRVARAVQNHPMISGRVNWDRVKVTDTKAKPSSDVISGANLVDLVRPFAIGTLTGRVPDGKNEQLKTKEKSLVGQVQNFLTALTEGFPEFEIDSTDNSLKVHPADVRASSLLGSTTILRGLAMAYYRLTRVTDEKGKTVVPELSHAAAVKYFAELSPHMGVPLSPDSRWFETGVFPDPKNGSEVRAPGARAQELKSLADQLTDWGRGLRLSGPLGDSVDYTN